MADYKTLDNELDPRIFMNLDIEDPAPTRPRKFESDSAYGVTEGQSGPKHRQPSLQSDMPA